jgi:glycosyltransferase involved in cell wall biosynthesis
LKVAYLLWRIKPDLVHVHWAHFSSYVGYGWKGPTVITAWGSDIYRTESFTPDAARRLSDCLRSATAITCDSTDLVERVRAITGRTDGVFLIQWGVDTELFFPGEPDPDFRHDLVKPNQPVILSIRNITPLYNLEIIVSALALVLKEIPEAILVMKKYNGDPDYVKAIEARIDQLGVRNSVRIVEEVPYDRMPDLYRLAQVTVSVPTSDATPMSMLEAMACGSVPIFTDLPSLREWIDDGHNGYLVDPQSPSTLARRIIEVLRTPQKADTFAAYNLELVRTRASQTVHMDRMEKIYERLARRATKAVDWTPSKEEA